MSTSESTCWTIIRAAAAVNPADREEMARRYLGVVRAYLAARWRGSGSDKLAEGSFVNRHFLVNNTVRYCRWSEVNLETLRFSASRRPLR